MQEETLDIGDNMDDEELEEEAVEEEEPAKPEQVRSKGRKKKKRAAHGKPSETCVNWTTKEHECLVQAWKTVSMDPISGTNQNTNTYWRRIKMVFDERKLADPEFSSIHRERDDKAMSNH
ncbi:putative methionyl-tRNA synthetase [Hordeum vulgare]|nr:putative methionyl-tRNA synthetase [Hordeum vulgare]